MVSPVFNIDDSHYSSVTGRSLKHAGYVTHVWLTHAHSTSEANNTQKETCFVQTKHGTRSYTTAPRVMALLHELWLLKYCLDLYGWVEQQIRHTDPTDTVDVALASHQPENHTLFECRPSTHGAIVFGITHSQKSSSPWYNQNSMFPMYRYFTSLSSLWQIWPIHSILYISCFSFYPTSRGMFLLQLRLIYCRCRGRVKRVG